MKININKVKKELIKNKKVILLSIILLVISSLLFFNFSKSVELLEDDAEVYPASDLIYYLTVTYDGKDRNGNVSGVNAEVNVFSDYIYVKDVLPEGLEFQEFVTGENGTVGAVRQNNKSLACVGGVINDTKTGEETNTNYHGLHYDSEKRTVHFRVQSLEAGCQLTVGIKTKTPATVDDPMTTDIVEKRRDFYNTAVAYEKTLYKQSNTVHAILLEGDVSTHKVTYTYDGSAPDNAPKLPGEQVYAENSKVNLPIEPVMPGYRFTGWVVKTQSGTILPYTSTSFVMPNEDVIVTGGFEKIENYTVNYVIEGDRPDNFVLPATKSYYENDIVAVDEMKVGDIIDGYKFLGWTSDDVTINSGEFIMPNKNVTIKGRFEKRKYTVTYKFYDGTPVELERLLPVTKEYAPGENVTLETIPDVDGYHFLGWYKEDFKMPEEDVIIYGEWTKQVGVFSPTIKKEIIDKKNVYEVGDEVTFKITITNLSSFDIKQVQISENNAKAHFYLHCVEGITCTEEALGYKLRTDHLIEINQIKANSSFDVYAKYVVDEGDSSTVSNEVELVGAVADDYVLDTSKEYKSNVTFNVKKKKLLKVCNVVDKEGTFQYKIVNKDGNFKSWFILTGTECKTFSLGDDEYIVTQLPMQDYVLTNVTGLIDKNGKEFTLPNDENEITFHNTYKRPGFYHMVGRIVNRIKGKK